MASPYDTHISSLKQQISSSSSSSFPTLSFTKLKTLLQTFIFSHLYRIARSIPKAKYLLFQLLDDIQVVCLVVTKSNKIINKRTKKKKKKLFLGSFRLHYNWCSSHVAPAPLPATDVRGEVYFDPTRNSFISTTTDDDYVDDQAVELTGYLRWLEEKGGSNNDIDRLADMFIADSHERFRLEKVESYRRFQEMLARSV
ncbi:hypothetical protein DM860_001017 [Cuscuta australis]|uniref:Uncharacterized protein n=1 Tax=Cuscuta australis TaxID=267555 RepID=A0A328DSJ5_9ASTE|nr:hypothetical protein DM860_001017 [Cuscuta australis]